MYDDDDDDNDQKVPAYHIAYIGLRKYNKRGFI